MKRRAVRPKSFCFQTIFKFFIIVSICVHPVHLWFKNPNSKYLWYKTRLGGILLFFAQRGRAYAVERMDCPFELVMTSET